MPGGFGDLTLLHTSYAVRLARAHMFPPGASAEEQAAQGAAWHAVIFWSALFYHLPLLAHLEGELFSGRGWQPGISVPDEAYRFRFRQLPPQGTEAQQLAAVIAGGLLPEGAAAWLATVPGALQNLAGAFWHQHPEMALIRDVLQESARQAESPLLNGGIVATASHIASAEVVTGEVVVSGKTESTVAPAVSGEEAAAEGNTCPAMLQSLFRNNQRCGNNRLRNRRHQTAVKVQRDDAACEMESIPTDEDTAMLVSMFAEEARAPEKGEDDSPSGEVVAPVSSTGEISAAGDDEEDFIAWLKMGLSSGMIEANTPSARVHYIAGYVFLSVPDIFFLYRKLTGKPARTQKIFRRCLSVPVSTKYVKENVFLACVCIRYQKRRGIIKTVSGYLVKGRYLYGYNKVPEDSAFIIFP
ncbi:helicase/Zfx/Zfy transcription activation region domain-containing protein [Escherichia coli]|uniref:Helicase/Zfx/Zfy transcription activation region domain-containing protein n=1 Tax=Escherichia coli TaxID=562 RepID=A0A376KJT9_ECOLX|nr:helicase/Zfx/Zfy transcription activation region domain-containing protein [Escherichia coli]